MNGEIENLANYLFIAGIIVLAIEILLLGLGTFVLTFLGLAMLLTGVLILTDNIAPTILSASASLAALTALLAILLWRPLKKLQNKTEHKPAKSDLVGYQFQLRTTVTPDTPSKIDYSGVTWQVAADEIIAAGTLVETTEVKVGLWKVKPVE